MVKSGQNTLKCVLKCVICCALYERSLLPYLQRHQTKPTMLCKDPIYFQFWEQLLCTEKKNIILIS